MNVLSYYSVSHSFAINLICQGSLASKDACDDQYIGLRPNSEKETETVMKYFGNALLYIVIRNQKIGDYRQL